MIKGDGTHDSNERVGAVGMAVFGKQITILRRDGGESTVTALEITPELMTHPDGRVELHVYVHHVDGHEPEGAQEPSPGRGGAARPHQAPRGSGGPGDQGRSVIALRVGDGPALVSDGARVDATP